VVKWGISSVIVLFSLLKSRIRNFINMEDRKLELTVLSVAQVVRVMLL
jgi:hypothetical protein